MSDPGDPAQKKFAGQTSLLQLIAPPELDPLDDEEELDPPDPPEVLPPDEAEPLAPSPEDEPVGPASIEGSMVVPPWVPAPGAGWSSGTSSPVMAPQPSVNARMASRSWPRPLAAGFTMSER